MTALLTTELSACDVARTLVQVRNVLKKRKTNTLFSKTPNRTFFIPQQQNRDISDSVRAHLNCMFHGWNMDEWQDFIDSHNDLQDAAVQNMNSSIPERLAIVAAAVQSPALHNLLDLLDSVGPTTKMRLLFKRTCHVTDLEMVRREVYKQNRLDTESFIDENDDDPEQKIGFQVDIQLDGDQVSVSTYGDHMCRFELHKILHPFLAQADDDDDDDDARVFSLGKNRKQCKQFFRALLLVLHFPIRGAIEQNSPVFRLAVIDDQVTVPDYFPTCTAAEQPSPKLPSITVPMYHSLATLLLLLKQVKVCTHDGRELKICSLFKTGTFHIPPQVRAQPHVRLLLNTVFKNWTLAKMKQVLADPDYAYEVNSFKDQIARLNDQDDDHKHVVSAVAAASASSSIIADLMQPVPKKTVQLTFSKTDSVTDLLYAKSFLVRLSVHNKSRKLLDWATPEQYESESEVMLDDFTIRITVKNNIDVHVHCTNPVLAPFCQRIVCQDAGHVRTVLQDVFNALHFPIWPVNEFQCPVWRVTRAKSSTKTLQIPDYL